MINIAILASGTGSNAKMLLEQEKFLSHIQIELIITDKSNAGVINIARHYNKKVIVVEKGILNKQKHENLIMNHLTKHNIDWIFLAGYMRILSTSFIKYFWSESLNQSKIINIHPSLLPAFKGLNAYEQAYQSADDYSGITVHFVDTGVDTGKIIKQEKFRRLQNDSLDTFKARGLELEHKIYPAVLEMLDKAISNNCYEELL